MSNYTHEAVIITPIALYDTASKLGRAFDPDVGGDRNFQLYLGNPKTHCCCFVRLTTETAGKFNYLLGDGGKAGELHDMVLNDYDNRWKDYTVPTLKECTDFLEQSKVYIYVVGEYSFESILLESNLEIYSEP